MQLPIMLLVPLQAVVASPIADEKTADPRSGTERFDSINNMIPSNDISLMTAEYVETLTTQVVDHLTPFITEFLSIQGKVDQDELKKKLFDIVYVQSLLTQLSSCKKNGLKILECLSAELPNLCRNEDTKAILEDSHVFANFHEVISDPSNGIVSIDRIANGSVDKATMKKLALAFIQDFHKVVTSETSIISFHNSGSMTLESDISGIRRSIAMLSWILGGFVVLIIIELALLILRRGK